MKKYLIAAFIVIFIAACAEKIEKGEMGPSLQELIQTGQETPSGEEGQVNGEETPTNGEINNGTTVPAGGAGTGEIPSAVEEAMPPLVAAGARHTCAKKGSHIYCWGNNEFGQLGNGLKNDSDSPKKINISEPVSIAAGAFHTCAVAGNDRHVMCWGQGKHGKLGNGSVEDFAVPVRVPELQGVKKVSAGINHTCALSLDGKIWCWGENIYGFTAEFGDSQTPKRIRDLGLATDIASGGLFTCAVMKEDGTVKCWGKNNFGQIGNGASDPKQVYLPSYVLADNTKRIKSIVSIAAGTDHACAATSEGELWCWGSNKKTYISDKTDAFFAFAQKANVNDVKAVYAGYLQTCAIKDDDLVPLCFGSLIREKDGHLLEEIKVPTQADDFENVMDVGIGLEHICISIRGEGLFCKGANTYGQTGIGQATPEYNDDFEKVE